MKGFLCGILLSILQRVPLGKKHHLVERNGTLYMGRWNLVGQYQTDANGRDDRTTRTMASRLLSSLTNGRVSSIRLHWIRKSDADRDLHNHPFYYWSLILKGFYVEQLLSGLRTHTAGSWNEGGPRQYHRILTVPEEGVWTLFFMGENTNSWGFLVDGEHVPSNTYFLRKRRAL